MKCSRGERDTMTEEKERKKERKRERERERERERKRVAVQREADVVNVLCAHT